MRGAGTAVLATHVCDQQHSLSSKQFAQPLGGTRLSRPWLGLDALSESATPMAPVEW